jgi:N-acyl-D-aspartate/D-glutamate deacylase
MRVAALILLGVLVFAPCTTAAADRYDLVLRGGRVIDPESGLDAVRNVGVQGGRIASVSAEPLDGDRSLDVSGLVVAPGFIDLHTHSPTPLGQAYQARDGVTTALELEAGAFPVEAFGSMLDDGPRLNWGASVGYGSIRVFVKHGLRMTHLVTGSPQPVGMRGWWTALRSLTGWRPTAVVDEAASPAERERLRSLLDAGLDAGGLGIGLPLDYISEAVDAAELRMIFDVAGRRNVPVFVHVRRGVNGDPAGLHEVLALARKTGAAVHVCHVTHNAMRAIDDFLAAIREARASGMDVTTEILPYNAGSALISSAVFGRDWQTIFAIGYEDVEWAETGERFTKEKWEEYRRERPEGQVIHHYLKEEWTRRALEEPGVIVVSDLLPMMTEESKVAPHNGAFARVLGRYARDEGVLPLVDALARMTILPARRLEHIAPRFARKGRVQVDADADLTVFDPRTVLDRATYQDPYQPSAGIPHVIVGGQPVVEHGELVANAHPGERLLAR